MHAEKACRVCLIEFDELTPLWVKPPGENKTLEETINFVVNINIKLEDGLPDKICKICESLLDVADTFKKRCLESELILEQKAQKKQSDESRSEINQIYSTENTCLPTSLHPALTDSLGGITDNIHDIPEHKIEVDVAAGVTVTTVSKQDAIQDFEPTKSGRGALMGAKHSTNEPCLINVEKSEKKCGKKEIFSCPHCGQTFRTKISYKVHILCSCEPEDSEIFSCALCKDTFTCKDSFEAHLGTHRSQNNSDINDQFTSSSGGDSQLVLFLSEELHQGEDTTDHPWPLAAHQTDGPSPKEPKLDDMQPTTAAVRSPTEDPAAADTSTDTVIETEGDFEIVQNIQTVQKKRHEKKINLKLKGQKKISKNKMKKESTKDTATMLKLSGTNTDDKTSGATETQATCISNTVIGATGDTLTCDICGYTATTEKSLNSHLKAHAAKKRYSCDSCSYLTINLSNFIKHARIHAVDKPYSCDMCDKVFRLKDNLVSHMTVHGEKPYSCNMCEKKFKFKSDIVRHRRIHTDVKLYSCDLCEKKFRDKRSIVQHLRIHTGEKPYSCDVCKMKFSQKPNLIRHTRTHTGDKPYSCNVCDWKFIQKKDVVSHLRTHTGEKPYSCIVCERKFRHKSNLVRHARSHTGDKEMYL